MLELHFEETFFLSIFQRNEMKEFYRKSSLFILLLHVRSAEPLLLRRITNFCNNSRIGSIYGMQRMTQLFHFLLDNHLQTFSQEHRFISFLQRNDTDISMESRVFQSLSLCLQKIPDSFGDFLILLLVFLSE